jgi:hypothetical protein
MIQDRVIREFRAELERSKQPGYKSTYDDYDHDVDLPPVHREHRDVAARTTTHAAEPQPRSPHKIAAPQQTNHNHGPHTPPAQQGIRRDGFGAGIL